MYSYTDLLKNLNDGKVDKVKEMLTENIREEAVSKDNKKKPYTIIKNMFRDCKDDERMYNKAMPMQDGRFAFLDGHRVFVADTNMGYTDRGDLQIEKILPTDNLDAELEIDVAELKQVVAIAKTEKKKYNPTPYIVEMDDYRVGMNPMFVKDLVDFTGNTKLKFVKQTRDGIQTAPLFSFDDEGKMVACILPVYIRD